MRSSGTSWRNSSSVIEWFRNLKEKEKFTFITFDVVNFYPSISEKLLKMAIDFAKEYTDISAKDIKIIMHARKSVLINNDTPWKKKSSIFPLSI